MKNELPAQTSLREQAKHYRKKAANFELKDGNWYLDTKNARFSFKTEQKRQKFIEMYKPEIVKIWNV